VTNVAAAEHWLCDMDGVLIRDGAMIDGADRFLDRLRTRGRSFLIITNNSLFTPGELRRRLASMGLEVEERQIWTSALATADYVRSQRPGGSAYVIGERAMHEALAAAGYREVDRDPDYVVLGETQRYDFDEFATATRLVLAGAHLVATNPEPTGPSAEGPLPGCGAMAALIERASGARAYFVGKPNPVMVREGLRILGGRHASTIIVGDRMETDILAGNEAGIDTILVRSGVTSEDDLERYPFQPTRVIDSIADLVDEL
jgi:5'-nucleotidase